MVKPGERVGALRNTDAKTAYLFGYGVFVGDRMHPDWEIENPCIELDGGGVVFGIECWWGPEAKIKEMCDARQVVMVPPPKRGPSSGGGERG